MGKKQDQDQEVLRAFNFNYNPNSIMPVGAIILGVFLTLAGHFSLQSQPSEESVERVANSVCSRANRSGPFNGDAFSACVDGRVSEHADTVKFFKDMRTGGVATAVGGLLLFPVASVVRRRVDERFALSESESPDPS